MDDAALKAFRVKVDETHAWPCVYVFKFIVPRWKLPDLLALFEGRAYATRDSANGKYVSLTAEWVVPSSADVIAVYVQALKIEGILTL